MGRSIRPVIAASVARLLHECHAALSVGSGGGGTPHHPPPRSRVGALRRRGSARQLLHAATSPAITARRAPQLSPCTSRLRLLAVGDGAAARQVRGRDREQPVLGARTPQRLRQPTPPAAPGGADVVATRRSTCSGSHETPPTSLRRCEAPTTHRRLATTTGTACGPRRDWAT